jgi:hypothetical protein
MGRAARWWMSKIGTTSNLKSKWIFAKIDLKSSFKVLLIREIDRVYLILAVSNLLHILALM